MIYYSKIIFFIRLYLISKNNSEWVKKDDKVWKNIIPWFDSLKTVK